ncbi:MAG: hypothetical protein ACRC3Z_12800 [Phocaeicola sp.]
MRRLKGRMRRVRGAGGLLLLALWMWTTVGCAEAQGEALTPRGKRTVQMLFPTSGLGGEGYVDMLLYGIQKGCMEHDVELTLLIPQNDEEGVECYQKWLKRGGDAQEKNLEQSLFIFATTAYESLLKREGMVPAPGSNQTVLMLESNLEWPGLHTSCMQTYGASYYWGALVATIYRQIQEREGVRYQAAICVANGAEPVLKNGERGFREGFTTHFGEPPLTFYLGTEKEQGFDSPDSAYRACMLLPETCRFVYPLAGGSNKGVYRFSRASGVLTAGMDGDMKNYSEWMIGSLLKRMDRYLIDLVGNWAAGGKMETSQTYYLEREGYVEVTREPLLEELIEGLGALEPRLFEEAKRKERSYEASW